MPEHLRGEACALAAAINWAFALILFKQCGERVPPMALNLFKNTLGLLLLFITLAAIGHGFDMILRFPGWMITFQIAGGVIGIAIADTAFFAALNRIGVGLISIVDCLYSPLALFFGWVLLSETLGMYDYIGGGLILVGVFVSSRHAPPPGRTRAQLTAGILLGVLAMALMTSSIIVVKPVLEVFPVVWATTLRLAGGTLGVAVLATASPRRRELWSVFRPTAIWKYSVPASLLGAYLGFFFWIGGFKWARVAVAAILNQTSTIFALILATIILKEAFTRRKAISATLAILGALLVTFG